MSACTVPAQNVGDNINSVFDFESETAEYRRGGSSKLIERGSYTVKGASGVFRMRERGQEVWGTEVPQKPEAETFLLMNA